jgi:hypothetical protein
VEVIGNCWDDNVNAKSVRGKRQVVDGPPVVAKDSVAFPNVGFLSAATVVQGNAVFRPRNLGVGRRIINPLNPLCK